MFRSVPPSLDCGLLQGNDLIVHFMLLILQQQLQMNVHMVRFAWWMGSHPGKEELKYASKVPGVPFVMMDGALLMHELSVSN